MFARINVYHTIPFYCVLVASILVVSVCFAGPPDAPPPGMNVHYGWKPVVDGVISNGEYSPDDMITFSSYGGNVQVYVLHDGENLYVAFNIPSTATNNAAQIFLDTLFDRATAPQTDDYRLTVRNDGNKFEHRGNGTTWGSLTPPDGWTVAHSDTGLGWQVEFKISFTKLGIVSGTPSTLDRKSVV